MKFRPSYFLLSLTIILSIFIGIVTWQNKYLKDLPKFNEKSYNAPYTSKYIPANSDLVFHWKLNPTTIPKYIENYQDKISKSIINKQTSFIRDSLFKLTSLDFERDISKWVGDYGSFAVVDSKEQSLNDWIMVLKIKDNDNTEKKLEFILGSKNIDESENQINILNASKKEIISIKINSNNSIYFKNDNDNLLIATNPKIIQSSLEKLDSNILNTRDKYKNIQLKDNLKDGFLLLEISPKNILNLIGEEENLFDMHEIDYFISSINLDEKKLNLEGIISYNFKTKMPNKDINYNLNDIKKESELHKDFILVDNPRVYFKNSYSHPYQKLINSLIQESIASDSFNLFKIILENTQGNFIGINDKEWLFLTRKSDINRSKVSDILKKYNFSSSNLYLSNRKPEIWTKTSTDINEQYKLNQIVGAIIDEDEEMYIWSQNLSAYSNLYNTNYFNDYSYSEKSRDEINDFDEVVRIHLGKEKTGAILNSFYPYILFKTMLGNKINTPQNIDISIAVPTINYSDFIKVKINLQTS